MNLPAVNENIQGLDSLKSLIPAYAKDIKLNLSSLLNDETLTQQQHWGTLLASALATRQATVIAAANADALDHLSAEAYDAVKAASAVMAMNNIYYRFVHLASNKEYQTMPAKLRMNVIGNPGVDKVDFELWSLAVSAINGCGMCIDAHEATLREHGVGSLEIQTAIRIASTINAVAAVLDTDMLLS